MNVPVSVGQSKIEELEHRLAASWPNLRAAGKLATGTRQQLRAELRDLDSEDTSIVVSGSLARDEFTPGSDIDWTLLVDGGADPRHFDVTQQVKDVVEKVASKPPGPEGTFGAMVFSHNLVHEIGGQDDTNQNTTRRLLLLLESCPVGREDAYQRWSRVS